MRTLESLARQLDAVDDIQSVVRVMKALSAASIQSWERAADAMEHYARTVDLGLQAALQDRIARGAGMPGAPGRGFAAPNRAARSARRGALIVIGSDRGMCGRFNDRIAAFAMRAMEKTDRSGADRSPFLCAVGLRAAARLSAAGREPDRLLTLPGSADGLAGTVQGLILELDRWSKREGVDHARVAFHQRSGPARSTPVSRWLIPAPRAELERLAARDWPSRGRPVFRMAPEALLGWLIRERTFVALYRALAESMASEHAARLASMQAADRNIDERREALTAEHRQRRQEAITREMLDVVAGYEASQSRV